MANLDRAGRGSAVETRGPLRSRWLPVALLPALALVAFPLPLLGETPETPDPENARVSNPSPPDFLFQRPGFSLGVKGGLFQWRAQGQLYDFTVDQFTAERSDFRGGDLGLELGFWPTDRWGITLGIDGTSTTLHTEDREWEEVDGTPIFQSTRVRQGPSLQVGARGYLLPRGEQLSRFIWVPARAAPFVAGGFGYTSYTFEQEGDFVEESPEGALIFAERFQSQGTTFVGWLGGGAEVALTPRLALTLEGRYQWGEDELAGDFRRFEPIDLSGLRLTAGLSVRF